MDCVGITAEFNPFHNGHKYMIETAKRESGCRFAVAIMSGNFVQRGDVAVVDKFTRAKCALKSGADMVIELPVTFALANAERFASGAIHLMDKSHIIKALAFGAEDEDISKISHAAEMMDESHSGENDRLKAAIKSGISYPRALAEALEITLPLSPNNILAIEYTRALNKMKSIIQPYAIKRLVVEHDNMSAVTGKYQSAGFIRKIILDESVAACSNYIPDESLYELCKTDIHILIQLSDAIIYSLRMKTKNELQMLPDVSEGFENVIYRTCRECANISDFMAITKTKRFTMARIRRIMLYSLLGIEKTKCSNAPLYIRVLGIRKDALPLLSELAKVSVLPVIKDFSDTKRITHIAKAELDFELRADCVYNMSSIHKNRVINDFSLPLLIVE